MFTKASNSYFTNTTDLYGVLYKRPKNEPSLKKIIKLISAILIIPLIAIKTIALEASTTKVSFQQRVFTKTKDFFVNNKPAIITTLLATVIAARIIQIYFRENNSTKNPFFFLDIFKPSPVSVTETAVKAPKPLSEHIPPLSPTEQEIRSRITKQLQESMPESIEIFNNRFGSIDTILFPDMFPLNQKKVKFNITDDNPENLVFSFEDNINQHFQSEENFNLKFPLETTKNHFKRCVEHHHAAKKALWYPERLLKSVFTPIRKANPTLFEVESQCQRIYANSVNFLADFFRADENAISNLEHNIIKDTHRYAHTKKFYEGLEISNLVRQQMQKTKGNS